MIISIAAYSFLDSILYQRLTDLSYFDQLFIAELVKVLLHLRDSLAHRPKGEVGVHRDGGQLLCLVLGDQHVVALQPRKEQHK